MRRELQEVLASAGYCLAAGVDIRERMIMVRNTGRLAQSAGRAKGFALQGFHLVLLDEKRQPTGYARCRPAEDSAFQRECALVELLSSDPVASSNVPQIRSASSERIRVQISKFLRNATEFNQDRALPPDPWEREALEVLAIKDRVCQRAQALVPSLVPAPVVNLGEAAAPALSFLASRGAFGNELTQIETFLNSAAPVGSRLQHGDFWPGNVLRADGTWWIIDYTELGLVNVPLYDTFHMIQSVARSGRFGRGPGWLGCDPSAPTAWQQVWTKLIRTRAEVASVSPKSLPSLLVFYLVWITAYRMRPGIKSIFSQQLAADLKMVIDLIERGEPVANAMPR